VVKVSILRIRILMAITPAKPIIISARTGCEVILKLFEPAAYGLSFVMTPEG